MLHLKHSDMCVTFVIVSLLNFLGKYVWYHNYEINFLETSVIEICLVGSVWTSSMLIIIIWLICGMVLKKFYITAYFLEDLFLEN